MLSILSPYLLWIKIAAGLALIASILYAGHKTADHLREQGRNEIRAEHAIAYAKQSAINRAKEASVLKQSQDKYNEYIHTKAALDVANGKLADADISLRNSIASYKRRLSEASKSTSGITEPREIGSDLLGECAERYSNLAKETGRLSDKANALIDQLNVIK